MEHKRKSELNLKIKKAEKIIKEFFAMAKKILEKDNEELVISDCGTGTVEQAKQFEEKKKYIYESPDKGKTIYAREIGSGLPRKLIQPAEVKEKTNEK